MGVILSFNENNNNTFGGSQTFHPVNSDAAITVVNDFLYNVNRTAGNFLFNDYAGNPSKPGPNSAIKAEIHLLDSSGPGAFPNQNAAAIIANVTTTAGSTRGWPTVNGILVNATDVSNTITNLNGILISTIVGPVLGTAVGLKIENQGANNAIITGTGTVEIGGTTSIAGPLYANTYYNRTATANSQILLQNTGSSITRNVADANTCLIVNQANVGSTGLIVDFQFNSTSKIGIDTNGNIFSIGNIYCNYMTNYASANNAQLYLSNSGTSITRNVADANPALIVNSVLGTGIILDVKLNGTSKFSANYYGITTQTAMTVASLPAGSVGQRSFVTNALAPAFGVAVAGGGAVGVPVYHDGTSWKVG